MILYVYALADGLDDVSGLAGVQNEALVLVPLPEVIAVCGWVAQAPAVSRDSLTAQDELVRALHARAAALLPLRFGAAVSDVDAAARAVHALGTGVRERLDRVRGRDQMTLRILGRHVERSETTEGAESAESAEGADGAGTRYLKSRAALAVPPAIAPLLDALKPFQRMTRVERGRHPDVVATVYQLIDRGSAEGYRQAAADASANVPALTVRISGPSPAYAFATP
jgi:Gas vesicle synthesis protein GvpL/GvpF